MMIKDLETHQALAEKALASVHGGSSGLPAGGSPGIMPGGCVDPVPAWPDSLLKDLEKQVDDLLKRLEPPVVYY